MIRTFHGVTIPRYVYRIDRGNYSGWLVAVPGTPRKFYNDKRFDSTEAALSCAGAASVAARFSLPNPYKPGKTLSGDYITKSVAVETPWRELSTLGRMKRIALFALRRLVRA